MAKKFNEGDKVRIYDEVYGWVKGYVTDTTAASVFVRWDDCSEPIEHPLSHEIFKIKK